MTPGERDRDDAPVDSLTALPAFSRALRDRLPPDTMAVAKRDWPRLRVVSIALLIPGALERFLADGSIDDLDRGPEDP